MLLQYNSQCVSSVHLFYMTSAITKKKLYAKHVLDSPFKFTTKYFSFVDFKATKIFIKIVIW